MNTKHIDILRILEENTDENNTLTRKKIHEKMKQKYPKISEKTITRLLNELVDLQYYDINYIESTRKGKDGKKQEVRTNWYLNKDFTDSELHLLIDGLLFSKYIPYSQCKEIVEKLKKQASKSFRLKANLPENEPENKQLLYTIEVLNEAIEAKDRVSFYFTAYELDKELHIILNDDGTPHLYKVSPYEIVVTNGRYYLICSHSKGEFFNYRLDYMREVKKIEDRQFRRIKDINGDNRDLIDLAKYMKEHIYMYGGESKRTEFRADKSIIGQIIDWFGKDVVLTPESNGDSVIAYVTVNQAAMLYWALQYGISVEILNPPALREQVRKAVRGMWEKYENGER